MPFAVECDQCRTRIALQRPAAPSHWIVVLIDNAVRTFCGRVCYEEHEGHSAWRSATAARRT